MRHSLAHQVGERHGEKSAALQARAIVSNDGTVLTATTTNANAFVYILLFSLRHMYKSNLCYFPSSSVEHHAIRAYHIDCAVRRLAKSIYAETSPVKTEWLCTPRYLHRSLPPTTPSTSLKPTQRPPLPTPDLPIPLGLTHLNGRIRRPIHFILASSPPPPLTLCVAALCTSTSIVV